MQVKNFDERGEGLKKAKQQKRGKNERHTEDEQAGRLSNHRPNQCVSHYQSQKSPEHELIAVAVIDFNRSRGPPAQDCIDPGGFTLVNCADDLMPGQRVNTSTRSDKQQDKPPRGAAHAGEAV